MTYTLTTDASGAPTLDPVSVDTPHTVPDGTEVTLDVTRTYTWTGDVADLPTSLRAVFKVQADAWSHGSYVDVDPDALDQVDGDLWTFMIENGDVETSEVEASGHLED